MDVLIGIALAIGVGLFGRHAGFDRERGFYPLVLIVTGSYYVLFAVCADSPSLLRELLAMAVFVALATAGFRQRRWLVAAGLVLHAALDAVHGEIIANAGVPPWWPGFCLSFDLVLAVYVGARLRWPRTVGASAERRAAAR